MKVQNPSIDHFEARLTRRALLTAPLMALPLNGEDPQASWQGISRVVAVGDLHGDCDALIAVLKMAGLINNKTEWVGGTAHLVQLGDLPARGGQARKAMDLLAKFEAQASSAGGRVHALIGNHEGMVMCGDYRSVLPEEFAEFRTPNSENALKAAYEKEVAERKRAGKFPSDATGAEEFKRKWFEYHVPGFVEYVEAFLPNGKYGSWIRSHNAVVRINNAIYMHGGISPKFLSIPIATMNKTIRAELAAPSKLPPGMTTNFDGPLWYRGLTEGDELELAEHVRAVLRTFGVKWIVVGHTVTRSAIMPRFGSSVLNIDIGLSKFYGRPPACLVFENGKSEVLHAGTRIPVPGPSKGERVAYLKAVAAADPQPEVIQKVIDRLNAV